MERRGLRRGVPTREPKDTPCHGLCLAYVHIREHDLLLYLFIFLFRELSPFSFLLYLPRLWSSRLCCYFHSRCHCNVSYVLSRGKLRNGICYVLSHVCVDVPELFRPRGHCGYSVHTLSFTLSVSLASEVRPLVSTLARCQALPLAVPRMGMTPIVIMLDVLFHIGL